MRRVSEAKLHRIFEAAHVKALLSVATLKVLQKAHRLGWTP